MLLTLWWPVISLSLRKRNFTSFFSRWFTGFEVKFPFFSSTALLSPATTLIHYWYFDTLLLLWNVTWSFSLSFISPFFFYCSHTLHRVFSIFGIRTACIHFRILWILLWHFELCATLWSKMDSAQSRRYISPLPLARVKLVSLQNHDQRNVRIIRL